MFAGPAGEMRRQASARSILRSTVRPATGWREFVPPTAQFMPLQDPFSLISGVGLRSGWLAYETLGTLSDARDNAILILTGLSPDSHVASHEADPSKGWWEDMVGPGAPIDTNEWFVICSNTLGSCKGSTGPASVDPLTGRVYGSSFPDLRMEDMADATASLVQHLGIGQLACAIGTSMGGMSVLALLLRHPGIARTMINVSGAPEAAPFAVAVRSLQREIIRSDPEWRGGDYDQDRYPDQGMTLARKLGIITYRSSDEWKDRFRRQTQTGERLTVSNGAFGSSEVERYLCHLAATFGRTFDANSYLCLGYAMDRFSVADLGGGSVHDALSMIYLDRALVIGTESDVLFPPHQQSEIARGLMAGGTATDLTMLDSRQGHDAFLADIEAFGRPIRAFLNDVPCGSHSKRGA